MTTERQIAANRRNALRSTGPKSPGGKRRIARNAVRHGLTTASLLPAEEAVVEDLALKICDQWPRALALAPAREVARAHVFLDRIRILKAEIMNRMFLFGSLTISPRFASVAIEAKYVRM